MERHTIDRISTSVLSAACTLLLLPVASGSAPVDVEPGTQTGIVDCLLPGQLRRVGGAIYQTPPRPARTMAMECEIRGGDFLLYDRANYETTLNHWISQAEQGSDSQAMLYVAEIYEQGIGRDPDYSKAAEWYQKSADAGNTTAMISLAHLYKKGLGVEIDLEQAQALYSAALGADMVVPLDPSSVAGADQRAETLMAEVDEIRRQKIAVELELTAAEAQLTSARRALNDAIAGSGTERETIERLQASIEQQQAEIETYKVQAERVRDEGAELTRLKAELEAQRGETTRLQAALDESQGEYERIRGQLDVQRDALAAEEAQFNGLLADMDSNRDAIQASKREVDELRATISGMESALREAEEDRDFYQAIASESTSHEERIAALSAQITMLEQRSNGMEDESASLRNDLATKQNELDAQIAAATSAQQLSQEQIEERDERIARLEATIRRTEQEKDRHNGDIDRLTRQSEELEALRADFEREQAQSNRLQQLLTETEQKFSASSQALEEAATVQVALEDEIESLRSNAAAGNEASQSLLRQRESELQAAQDDIERLRLQVRESENEFDQFRQQMTDTAERRTVAIESLRAAVAASRAERNELEHQLSMANQQLADASSDLDLERARLAQLQDELRVARTQQDDSSEALARKQARLDEQSKEIESLQLEVARLNEQSERYVVQINELKVIAQSEGDQVDFVGPSIVLLEPSESVLGTSEMPTRGAETMTRGISVVAATQISETKVIRGRVEAPAGLAKLTINGMQVPFDEHYAFRQPFELDEESKPIRIVAVDHHGKRGIKEFEYRVDGTMVGGNGTTRGGPFGGDQSPLPPRNDALDHLKYYALVIANKDYEGGFLNDLQTPFDDAKEVERVLKERYHFEVDVLYNATKRDLEKAFEEIFYHAPTDDNPDNDWDALLVYYAGHGVASDSRTKEAYFWLPVDAEFDSPSTWYKTSELEQYLEHSDVNQIMVVADSCFAGNVLSRDGIAGNFASLKSRQWRRYLKEYTEKKRSRYAFTSGAFAPVLDGGGGKHSVFAKAFLDVLQQNAEILSAPKMHEQVAPVVMDLAARFDHKQTPLFGYLTSAGHEFGNFYLPAPYTAPIEAVAASPVDNPDSLLDYFVSASR